MKPTHFTFGTYGWLSKYAAQPAICRLPAPAEAAPAIHNAAWAIICDCGETEGVREWPEGSGQAIWWKGAPTGEGTEWENYGDDDYESTVRSGIAIPMPA